MSTLRRSGSYRRNESSTLGRHRSTPTRVNSGSHVPPVTNKSQQFKSQNSSAGIESNQLGRNRSSPARAQNAAGDSSKISLYRRRSSPTSVLDIVSEEQESQFHVMKDEAISTTGIELVLQENVEYSSKPGNERVAAKGKAEEAKVHREDKEENTTNTQAESGIITKNNAEKDQPTPKRSQANSNVDAELSKFISWLKKESDEAKAINKRKVAIKAAKKKKKAEMKQKQDGIPPTTTEARTESSNKEARPESNYTEVDSESKSGEVEPNEAQPESNYTEVDPESSSSEALCPKMMPSEWPHKPVFVQAGRGLKVFGLGNDQPVPLGVPFNIESALFKGKMLLRFRNSKTDDPKSHSKYFDGHKRLMQCVLQGRFKRPLKMSEVYSGSIFAQPLAAAPPPRMAKIMDAIIRRVAPGLIMDLTSEAPRVIALLAGASQAMSIDHPGEEPDITLPVIEENVASVLGKSVATKSKRRKVLGNPNKAATYMFNTDSVYTFHSYDDAMDYGRGTMRIPMYGEYDIKPSIGPQPLSLTAVTQSGEVLYDLRIWHESNHK